jgi:hypothetical protein
VNSKNLDDRKYNSKSTLNNFDEMKYWYDGYIIDGIHVYNPKSVTDAIR